MYVVLLIYGLAVAVCCRPTASVSRRLAVSSSDASIDARGCCRYINCSAVLVLRPINGKHTDRFTFWLDINNVPSLYYPAIHLHILHAFISQAIRYKNLRLTKVFYGTVAAAASFSFIVSNVKFRVVVCSWTVCMHIHMSARLAEYCVNTGSYFRFLVRPTIS